MIQPRLIPQERRRGKALLRGGLPVLHRMRTCPDEALYREVVKGLPVSQQPQFSQFDIERGR